MQIGIIINSQSHYECIGFICDTLKNNNIVIYYTDDKYGWLTFFSETYTFQKKNDEFKNNTFAECDIIIKLTEEDNIPEHTELMYNKTIFVLHSNSNNQYKNAIFLSPFLQSSSINKYWMLPIYNTNFSNYAPNNIILYIGLIETYYFTKDLNKFIKTFPDYKFIFIGRRKKTDVEQHIKTLNMPNIEFYQNMHTTQLIDYVKQSKFILCRRYPFQSKKFTGAIALGLSFNKPLIIQEKYNCGYNAPCITFNEIYTEVSNKINEITHEKYIKLIDDIVLYTTKMRENNQKIMKTIINNIINT